MANLDARARDGNTVVDERRGAVFGRERHDSRRHVDLFPPRRKVHRTDRRPRWRPARVRRRLHVWRLSAAAVPACLAGWTSSDPWRHVGRARSAGGTALVSHVPGHAASPRRRAALDEPFAELELHVRGVPLDEPPQGICRGGGSVRHDVDRSQCRVRELSRPWLAARRVGSTATRGRGGSTRRGHWPDESGRRRWRVVDLRFGNRHRAAETVRCRRTSKSRCAHAATPGARS